MRTYKSIEESVPMNRRFRSRRGSIIVEAAIFLPVFLIAVLTLGLLIRQTGTEETVLHAMLNQGRLASVTAYSGLQARPDEEDGIYGTAAGLGSRQLFRIGVQTQLNKELGLEAEDVKLREFQYLYEADNRDSLTEAAVRYSVKVPLPKAIRENMLGEEHIVLRAFVGRNKKRNCGTAEEMEEEKESCIVYIFPRSGKRYHGGDCTVVTSSPVRCVLTEKLKKRYDACRMCDADAMGLGSLVYCYTGYGEVYHRGSCKAVDKYVTAIEKEEAEKRGYTPCSKCGGGA